MTPIRQPWKGTMTARERFNRQMHWKSVDRSFNMEFGYWKENFKLWPLFTENGITNNGEADLFFSFDPIRQIGGNSAVLTHRFINMIVPVNGAQRRFCTGRSSGLDGMDPALNSAGLPLRVPDSSASQMVSLSIMNARSAGSRQSWDPSRRSAAPCRVRAYSHRRRAAYKT